MRKETVLCVCTIILVVLITYLPALKIDFLANDWWFLNNATRLNFQQHFSQYFDPRLQTYGFRPLQGFQFFFEHALFRESSAGYHLFHILFHAIDCLLLFAIVWQLSKKLRFALVAALIYATLPVFSVAVMWVGVADPVTMPFFLLTVWLWIRHLQTNRPLFYRLALLTFVMTMMGKEVVVLLPLVLFLLDRLVLQDQINLDGLIRRYAPFAMLLVPYLIYEYSVQKNGAFVTMAGYSFGLHILVNLVQYLALLVFPWSVNPQFNSANYVWLLIVAALFVLIILLTRNKALLFLGISAVLGILPVLGFESVWFDSRYLYSSGMIVAVLLAYGFEIAASKFSRQKWQSILVAVVLVGLVLVNGTIIANAASGLIELTRQRRVAFRDVARQHPDFEPNSYLYFFPMRSVRAFDLAVMFLLHYGSNPVVEGTDNIQMGRWYDYSKAYMYYADESGKPVEVLVDQAANLRSSPSTPINLQVPIRLEGFAVPRRDYKQGGMLPLLLYWRATGKIDLDYTVFVHLLDQQGQTVAGNDSQPCGGQCPTSSWTTNLLTIDPILIPLNEDVPMGAGYRVEIGMYYLPTLERVGIVDAAGHVFADSVILESFDVTK